MFNKDIFVIAGMPRAGTTFLYYYLQNHPDIFAPVRKEINYFSVFNYKGEKWYNELFDNMSNEKYGMDISPSYFLDNNSASKIKAFDPNIKVIIGVRKPSDWVVSFFKQINTHSYNAGNIFDVLKPNYPWKIGDQVFNIDLTPPFFRNRIEQYKNIFHDNLLLYDFNSFEKDPLKILNSIEDFLKIPRYFSGDNFTNKIINASSRNNSKFITYLFKQELVIKVITAIFPDKLIINAKKWLIERQGLTHKSQIKNPDYSGNNLKIAEYFKSDDLYYDSLFYNGTAIITGNNI